MAEGMRYGNQQFMIALAAYNDPKEQLLRVRKDFRIRQKPIEGSIGDQQHEIALAAWKATH